MTRILAVIMAVLTTTSCFDNNKTNKLLAEKSMTKDSLPHKGIAEGSVTKILSMKLQPYLSPCTGMMQVLCKQVTFEGQVKPGLFYDNIAGFDFHWGHSYQLKVKVKEIESPLQDASALEYQLVKIISDKEDVIGTKYNFKRVNLTERTFYQQDNHYFFLGSRFECALEVNCEKLISLNNSGALVNVTFEYAGDSSIKLLQWF